ncbi:MAG TPA: Ku protein [Gemmatimonadaceae bacterium]|nr:Ku protein [Gemmatimonadaceae bacterium]
MAAAWKGTISFGLVSIPVELRTAVKSDHVSFRMLHAEDLAPVKYERVCERDGEPVPWNEIVKGYEYTKGKYVILSDEDFRAAALATSKTIDILDFVRAEEIDQRFFDTPYFVVPAKGGEKGYALLREAIRTTGSVGVGKLTMHQKQHLAALKTVGKALMVETMRFANELLDSTELTFPSDELVRPQELKMAAQLVANLAEPFQPEKYTDDYRANLMKIIRAKMKGQKIEAPEPEERESTQVLDLMARLQASLEQSTSRRRKTAEPRKQRTRRRSTA